MDKRHVTRAMNRSPTPRAQRKVTWACPVWRRRRSPWCTSKEREACVPDNPMSERVCCETGVNSYGASICRRKTVVAGQGARTAITGRQP